MAQPLAKIKKFLCVRQLGSNCKLHRRRISFLFTSDQNQIMPSQIPLLLCRLLQLILTSQLLGQPLSLSLALSRSSSQPWFPSQLEPPSPQCVCFVNRPASDSSQHQQQQLYCRNRHSLPAGDSASHMGGRPVTLDFLCSHGRLFVRSAGVTAIEGELARSLDVASELQWLDLSGNQIGALHQPHFASLPNLRRLDLQGNAIASLSYTAFKRLRFLVYLNLGDNRLEEITGSTFGTRQVRSAVRKGGPECGLRSLRFLYLNNNRIRRIEPNSFECLDGLTELRLERNLIAVLPNFAFKWLNSLTSLKLHSNQLESVEEFAFSQCCSQITRLSLVDNRLAYLPDQLLVGMPNLTVLQLDRNQFDRVPSVRGPLQRIDFHLQRNHITRIRRSHFLAWSTAAESVNLYDNSVRWIEDGAFVGLQPGTVNLVLQKNELSRLGKRTLDGLTDLRYLVLADNRIQSIQDGAFRQLVRLETLSLAGNRLAYLRPDMFLGLNRTFALSLGGNQISRLPMGAFSRLPSLKYLYLEKNGLVALPAGIFAGFYRLKKLDLSDNRIASLHPLALDSQTELAFLDLSGNRIGRLCSEALRGPAPSLSFLSLAKNRLTRLDPDLLAGLNRLRVLDLSNNRLTRFDGDQSDPQLTGGPSQLRTLDLVGNPQLRLTDCSLCGLETLRHVRLPGANDSDSSVDLVDGPTPCSRLGQRAACQDRTRASLDKLRSEACQQTGENLDDDLDAAADGKPSIRGGTAATSLVDTEGTSTADSSLHRAMLLVTLPALCLLLLTLLALGTVYCCWSSMQRRRQRRSRPDASELCRSPLAGTAACRPGQLIQRGYQPDVNLLELNVEQQQQQQQHQQARRHRQHQRRSYCSSSATSAISTEMPKFSNKVYSNLL